MSDDQLFGREATEAAQGYTPMPEPVADKPDPELEHAQAIERIIDRDPPSPIVERKYVRADDDSKPQPDNRTVELDRAAEDLAQNRIAEAAIAEIERDLQLANEIDAARREGLGQSVRAQDQQPVAPEQPHTPLVSELQQPQNAPADGVDPEVAAALRNPKILSALTDHYSAAQVQVNAAVSHAEQRVTAAVQQTADFSRQIAEVAALALINRPELKNIPPGQLPGALAALAQSNPQAAADINAQLTRVQTLSQQAQQAAQVQQQRSAIQFQQYAAQQDDAFERSMANEHPETVKAIRQTAMTMMRETGLSDQDLAHLWQTNALLRSLQGQNIVADAARYRLLKSGTKPAPKALAPVQRPGSSVDRPDAAGRDSFALEQRFQGPLSAKEAAQLLIGRRARSSR